MHALFLLSVLGAASRQVDEGLTYRLGAGEREAHHSRDAEAARLERLRQVREQEKQWARFKAKEYRASVADHHAELTYQLHEGWLRARRKKQRELEDDCRSAAAGMGRAHKLAAHLDDTRKTRASDRAIASVDDELRALERFETALGKELARLDALEAPHFAARDRREGAHQVAAHARAEMRDRLERTAALRERVTARRNLEANLLAETASRVAAPLRPDAYKHTHFNDLVVNTAGVGVGLVRVERQARRGPTPTSNGRTDDRENTGKDAMDGGTQSANEGTTGGSLDAHSAFARAYAEERRLAASRDADLRRLRRARAKEAERSNAAAVRVRVMSSKAALEKQLDDEARRERAARVAAMRRPAGAGGLVHAPLLKTWQEKKKRREALSAFEEAFIHPPGADGVSPPAGVGGPSTTARPGGITGPSAASTTIPAGTRGALPASPGLTRSRVYFDDAAPFLPEGAASLGAMFDDEVEEARYREVAGRETYREETRRGEWAVGGAVDPLERVLAMAATAVAASEEAGPVVGDAPERLAKMGVVGATAEEVAAVIAAGDSVIASPNPNPGLMDAGFNPGAVAGDDSDDDFVGAAGGAGLPEGDLFLEDAQLDALLASAALHPPTPSVFGAGATGAAFAAATAAGVCLDVTTGEPVESPGAAAAMAELQLQERGILDESSTMLMRGAAGFESPSSAAVAAVMGDVAGVDDLDVDDLDELSQSVNLSANTTHLFSATMDDAAVGSTSASAGRATGASSFLARPPPPSSSSGTAEEALRVSLAATARAVDATNAATATATAAAAAVGMPGRVELPELKSLDAVLGKLGQHVHELDAAAALAAAAAAPPPESSSSGLSDLGAGLNDTSLAYAAASAAANNSAPLSSATLETVDEAHHSTHPTATATVATPPLPAARDGDGTSEVSGSPRDVVPDAGVATPPSVGNEGYTLQPQRDASHMKHEARELAADLNLDGTNYGYPAPEPEMAQIAAKFAAAAVAQNPGEQAEVVAKQVAAAMADELARHRWHTQQQQQQPRTPESPKLWEGEDSNVDSSWAQALGQDSEWAASLVDTTAAVAHISSDAQSPPTPNLRYRRAAADVAVAEAAAEAELTAAEASFRSLVAAKEVDVNATPRAAPIRVVMGDDVAAGEPTLVPSLPRTGDVAADTAADVAGQGVAAAGGWQRMGLDGSVDIDTSLSLDGRSLAALANALDARSFDVASEEEECSEDDKEASVSCREEDTSVGKKGFAWIVEDPPTQPMQRSRPALAVGRSEASAGAQTAVEVKTKGAHKKKTKKKSGGGVSVTRRSAVASAAADLLRLSGGPTPCVVVPSDAAGSKEKEKEATARRRAEAAALRKKAAALDKKHREMLRNKTR